MAYESLERTRTGCVLPGDAARAAPCRMSSAPNGRSSRCGFCFYHRVADTIPNSLDDADANVRRTIRMAPRAVRYRDAVGSAAAITAGNSQADGLHHVRRWLCRQSPFAIPLLLEQNVPFTYFVSTESRSAWRRVSARSRGRPPLAVNTLAAAARAGRGWCRDRCPHSQPRKFGRSEISRTTN